MDIGKLGLWTICDNMNAAETLRLVRKVERLGYGTFWIPEAWGRDPFSHAAYLLSHSDRVALATGIANIWSRDTLTMMSCAKTVAELAGGRFVLGLGVSHKPLVADLRGHDYSKPFTRMKSYVAGLKSAIYKAVPPREEVPIVIAALHPRMLQLAAAETRGTHTYFVPPAHTARARAEMGPQSWICVEQAVILESDKAKARHAARQYMSFYLPLPNYARSLKSLGFTDADIAQGGSDRLVDAIVAWGAEDKIRDRIAEHFAAGATHVCIQPLLSDGTGALDERAIEALAP
ncbi:MAG TPA: TIGR03620 family F420-dependent LLM class oxidoreductase [Candidatus Binataceae bacterium]|nr:TIGR03620 family F420-dependent LLM class oxidoreductase [Candidatus Binataceae bacterium]